MIRRDDIDGDPAGAQRCSDFEANEAGPHDDDAFRGRDAGDDRPAVTERPEVVDRDCRCARNSQANWFGTSRDQELSERVSPSVIESTLLSRTSSVDTRAPSTRSMCCSA